MSKNKNSLELVDPQDIEMQALENSAEMASNFINDELLPKLDEFETSNDDPEYMIGIATHGLFVAVVQRMSELGYTEKDLRKELKVYMNTSIGQVLH